MEIWLEHLDALEFATNKALERGDQRRAEHYARRYHEVRAEIEKAL